MKKFFNSTYKYIDQNLLKVSGNFIGYFLGFGFLYSGLYYPLRLISIGEVKSYTVSDIYMIPGGPGPDENYSPDLYFVNFSEVNYHVSISKEYSNNLKIGEKVNVWTNEHLNYGIIIRGSKKTSFRDLEQELSIPIAIVILLLQLFQLFVGFILLRGILIKKIKKFKSKLVAQTDRTLQNLTLTKEILTYTPLIGIAITLSLILIKGVLKAETVSATLTGYIMHFGSMAIAFGPYLILKTKAYFEEAKIVKIIILWIKIIVTFYAFIRMLYFLFTEDFALFNNVSELLKSLFKFLVG